MAAVTPASITRENGGSLNVIIVSFTSAINDTDTWSSGIITGYRYHMFQPTNNPTTQASAGVHVAYSAGTFTFYPGENGATGFLVVFVDS